MQVVTRIYYGRTAIRLERSGDCPAHWGALQIRSGSRERGEAYVDQCRHLTPAAVCPIGKEVFQRGADMCCAGDAADAEALRRASTLWSRRSSASHQPDAGTDLRFIQKNMRHASIQTTGIYLHAEDDLRHAETVRESDGAVASEMHGPVDSQTGALL